MQKIPVKTKYGIFSLFVTPKGLCAVRFPGKNPAHTPGVCLGTHRVCERVKRAFAVYFKDPKTVFKMDLDLSRCTEFERNVYRALQRVPAGTVITYGSLAKRAGHPGAARAVGTAMRKNPLPIVIPCHRVIPSKGGLGAYSAGTKWKRTLLEHERTVSAQRSLSLET
ncbi:MAG: methylated-DNA--[protein]-cysteine S-methyltransferase [Candidatus Omnitrophota bacterium]